MDVLAPKPRANLNRFWGLFVPNSKHHVDVKAAKRSNDSCHHERHNKTPRQWCKSITWAQRLKLVFSIEVFVYSLCGSEVRA
jgi:hypothetical protein